MCTSPRPRSLSCRGTFLLYRATCAKCRTISLAIVWLSLGSLRRVPLSSPEATRWYEERNVRPGKLVLVDQQHIFSGWRVLPGLFALPVLAILSTLRKP
jgi:hypothetical protein